MQYYTCSLLLLLIHSLVGIVDGEKSLKLDIYPGYGWDHLRLLEMNPVYDVSNFNDSDVFQSCIEMLPIRQSKIDLESDIVDLYDSRSVDYASKYVMEGSLNFEKFKLGGSYESNYQKIKKQQSHERTIAIRNELSILVADVILSSNCPLNYRVKKDLIEIAKYSQNQPLSASYAAQMFIRKYGTHFTSRIQLGGTIVEEDFFLLSDFNSTETIVRQQKAAAEASFLKTFKLINCSFIISRNSRNTTENIALDD
ncbi:unnamed protein product [Didymodactylos carnosus]|uniref:MACPF domain-containing protein n=1 Tax=Didymodactylos carnosus TaxID=1234261 RepID=A0A814M763_9BILA|nr:unnamed protein product [Didymodactylos carnosus]CAF3842072.1 unnamed protein product [Didymodactylos carnosus]